MLDPKMNLNHFQVQARLVSKNAVRYTPAGLPVMDCDIAYSGNVVEAGMERKLQVKIPAIGIGEVAKTLYHLELEQQFEANGFIAHQGIHRQALVFHITNIII